MGADPTSSAWKADVLAGKLYLHDPMSEEQLPWPPKTFTDIPERSNPNQTTVNLLNRVVATPPGLEPGQRMMTLTDG